MDPSPKKTRPPALRPVNRATVREDFQRVSDVSLREYFNRYSLRSTR